MDEELEPTEAPAEPAADLGKLLKAVARLEANLETLDRHLKDSMETYQFLDGKIENNMEHIARVEKTADKAYEKACVLLPEVSHCQHCGGKVQPRDAKCRRCGKDHGVRA